MRLARHGLLRSLMLWTMLLVALAPTVSRLLASDHPSAAWQLICTGRGAQWVSANFADPATADSDTPTSPADGESMPGVDRCPLCVLGLRALPLPTFMPGLLQQVQWQLRYWVLSAGPDCFSPACNPYRTTPPLRAPPVAAR